MPQAAPHTDVRREDLPLAGRSMELRDFVRAVPSDEKAPLATARLVFTTGAAVRRYDWYRERPYLEQLVVEDGAIRLGRLERGAPVLNTHSAWDLEDQLGVTQNPRIAAGEGECSVTFSRRASVAGYVQDVEDGIIRNVSVGYVRHVMEMVPPAQEGGMWVYRVVDWEPIEVSLVPVPADMDAQVRSAALQQPADKNKQLRTFTCEFIEVRTAPLLPTVGDTAATTRTKEPTMTEAELQAQREKEEAAKRAAQAAEDTRKAQEAAEKATLERAADITSLCQRHGLPQLAADLIRSGKGVDQAGREILDELARRDQASGGHRNARVETVSDEVQTRMEGMAEALMNRVDSRTKLTDNGRQYRGFTLLEIGRDWLESRGVNTRGIDKMTLAQRILHFRSLDDGFQFRAGPGMLGSSDFGNVLANVANKRLRGTYEENPGTFTRWARRAPNAPDFKNMTIVQLSAMPDLLKVNEHGEFKYGAMSDGKETYALLTYGRIVSLTRQALVNDDLRVFDRMMTGFGGSAARLENRTAYAQLTANAALADGTALFHANHANLGTGAGSALQESSLNTARTAMRLQKGLQNEELNIVPTTLIVPAALEQTAYKLTSSNYVPSTQTAVNEFRQGGRTALDPVIEPILDANSATAWYLTANNSQVDTIEYCWLDGAEGPVLESEMGFEVDGISLKCREDFAAKAIDFRGLYKANGAA